MCEIQLSWWIVLNIINEKYFKIWKTWGPSGSNLRHLSCHCWKWAHKTDKKCVQGFEYISCVSSQCMQNLWKTEGSLGEIDINKGELSSEIKYKHLNPEEKYVLRKPLMVEDWLGESSRSKRRWYRGGAFYIRGLSWSVMSGFLPPHVKPSSVKCRIVTS